MKFGYARVSTNKQDLSRQIEFLLNSGVDEKNIFTEKRSGSVSKRPQLEILKLKLREDDIIYIESFSRLGRSTSDLLNLMREFEEKCVTIISHKESFDMSSASGKLMLTMIAAVSQFEREITIERVKEGLEIARIEGKTGGRPRKDPKLVTKAVELYHSGTYTLKEIEALTTVKPSTLYKALKATTP